MPNSWNWFVLIFIIFYAGGSAAQAVEPEPPRHLITPKEAQAIKLRMKLERFPLRREEARYERNGLRLFYAARTDGLVWFNGNNLNARAKNILAVLKNASSWGLDAAQFELPRHLTRNGYTVSSPKAKIEAELHIGLAILRYARHACGGQINPARLSLDFDRKPQLENPQRLLSELLLTKNPRAYLEKLHPPHVQFHRLRKKYVYLLERSKTRKLSRRQRHLLAKIKINMHLWRWMPRDMGNRYIWANIPEYAVKIVDRNRTVYRERIVVGKTSHKTPLFSDEMEKVVFQPYWYVPNSIKVKEVLPRLLAGASPNGYKIAAKFGGRPINPHKINWYQQDIRKFVVYQPPGRRNALGKVKFIFPNKHAVYLHDTPKKHLFRYRRRAFSHGCLRVRNPLNFALALLSKDRKWKSWQVKRAAKHGPANKAVYLRRKVPVHIVYFTAWVKNNGKLRTFRDIYGHERLIGRGLDGKIDITKPPKKENLSKIRLSILDKYGVRRKRKKMAQRPLQRQHIRPAARKKRTYAANYSYSARHYTQLRER